jgi:hypothetical protein
MSVTPDPAPALGTAVRATSRDHWLWGLGVVLGAFAGFIEVQVGDLLLTAFLVLAFTMFLAFARPERPWRWTLLISSCIPVARLVAALLLHEYTQRAQIYESFLAFLPGVVGAYGGHFMRHVIDRIFLN